MDDITEKLTQLLNDPAGMEQIRSMAEGLFGQGGVPGLPPQQKAPAPMGELSELMQGVRPEQMGSLLKIARALGSVREDDRTRLLLALRPHLTGKRQERIDQAVKLLKIASILPMIGESGLFSL